MEFRGTLKFITMFQLNDTAVELFFADGTTRLFSFGDRKKRNGFLRKLGDSLPPSLVRHELILNS